MVGTRSIASLLVLYQNKIHGSAFPLQNLLMKLFLFLILLSTSCFGQSILLEKSFYKKFKVDSLILGDWTLIETHANGKVIREQTHFGLFDSSPSSWMKITKDSLFQFNRESGRSSKISPNEFSYELTIDPGIRDFQLDIFQREKKEVIRYKRFDFWFRNFDELVISSESRVDDGIGITPVTISYVFKRAGSGRLTENLTWKPWFYCPDENEQFLKLKSDQRFVFYWDSTQNTSCTDSQKCLNFKKETLRQIDWSQEKPNGSKEFKAFFGSDAKVFWDNSTNKIYFFNGAAVLVYTIEELDYNRLVLKQDHGSTIK
jgi:hypothetical protein